MSQSEQKVLAVVSIMGFVLNIVLGMLGTIAEENSKFQLVSWRLGDTSAVMASLAASRYVALRGFHVASTGLILLGIVHGISAAGSGIEQLYLDSVSLALPMVPALILISWCGLFPKWSRVTGLLLIPLWIVMYYRVVFAGLSWMHVTTYLSFLLTGLLELIWGILIWRDYKSAITNQTPQK